MLLAHTHSPYAWQADVDTTVVIPALSLLYLFLVGRFGAPRWRIVCFAGSIVLLAVAFWTPLHHLGLHYLLTAHLLQNVILAEWAPLLAVLGLSPAMAVAASRFHVWRFLVHPAVALPVWLVNYFAWHVPVVCDAALDHQSWLHPRRARVLLRDGPALLVAARAGRTAAAAVGGTRRLRVRRVRVRLAARAALRAPAEARTVLRPRPASYLGPVPARRPGIGGLTMASEQAIVLFFVVLYSFRRFLAEEGA